MNEILSFEPLRAFVDAMREELQQYGEMLARLDDLDHGKVRNASSEGLMQAVKKQAKVIQATCSRRAEIERQLVFCLGLPAAVDPADVVKFVPPTYQPLVKALMDENNELPRRIQQRADPGDEGSVLL